MRIRYTFDEQNHLPNIYIFTILELTNYDFLPPHNSYWIMNNFVKGRAIIRKYC
jgi:hypothetical protein